MDNVTLAFLFGALSALSLPLGALAGLWLNPGLRLTAAIMAFGAGALLCALALELVVPALEHFPNQPLRGFAWLALGAMLGCLLFLLLDYLLGNMGAYLRKTSTIAARLKRLKKHHFRKILDKLSVLDLMVNLPPEDIRRVVSDIEKRVFQAGEVICHEEDPCDALFLIESGRVRILAHDDGQGAEPAFVGPGEAFGELALVTGLPPIARAEAVEDTIVWEVHKDDFREVVAVSPKLRRTLGHLAQRRGGKAAPAAVIDPEQSAAWLDAASRNLESELGAPTEAEIVQAAHREHLEGGKVALAIWLGIALDVLANFPESMSSAIVMKKQGSKNWPIIGMWLLLMIMTAVGAAAGNLFIADAPRHLHGLLEGMAAGAMLAMIAQTMLPEAYDHGGWLTGLMTVTGFLAAIFMGTFNA
jgi:CRP-like cAMP-binding protein